MDRRGSIQGNLKIELNVNANINIKVCGKQAKAVLRGNYIVLNSYIRRKVSHQYYVLPLQECGTRRAK